MENNLFFGNQGSSLYILNKNINGKITILSNNFTNNDDSVLSLENPGKFFLKIQISLIIMERLGLVYIIQNPIRISPLI